jgi:hypothetical protein
MSVTYYVVVPFTTDESGDLVPLEPIEAQSARSAMRKAADLATGRGGAIAFSRTGDPATGDFEEAVVLERYGEVPVDLTGVLG